jgi:glucose/arabinose dehydrogenase
VGRRLADLPALEAEGADERQAPDLEDTDGDGKADKMTVFADDLHNPTGFEFYNGGVLVAQAPDLMFLKDTDGDDKADVRIQRVLHGLDSADTHHTPTASPRPRRRAVLPGGHVPPLAGRDAVRPAQALANGGVFRYEPRTQKFDVYVAYGFANPHGHVFDRWGQDIVIDGTGAQPYHAALFSGHLEFPATSTRRRRRSTSSAPGPARHRDPLQPALPAEFETRATCWSPT